MNVSVFSDQVGINDLTDVFGMIVTNIRAISIVTVYAGSGILSRS